jgi:hypothetical protein
MMLTLPTAAGFLSCALALALSIGAFPAEARAETEDYLTAEEVEKLREAQEPHLRIKLLGELLEDRLDKAKALKDPSSIKPKTPEPTTDKKKSRKPGKDDVAPVEKPGEPAESKSFLAWMDGYLQCLEEVSNNIENFSSTPVEPKGYLKSLKKVAGIVEEHSQWVSQIESRLERPEKKRLADVSEVLVELAADLKEAIEKAQEQARLLKEAEKARTSRRR